VTLVEPASVADLLKAKHYLGPTRRGFALQDMAGVLVFAAPTSRRLPKEWLELTRWCITAGKKNAGSQQWARAARWLKQNRQETTVVSYSDPAVGHTGALYRACNWEWAPTWLRLRPPPSGQGCWKGTKQESVKDRWVFSLRPDDRRGVLLQVMDKSIVKRMPWASYPGNYQRWKKEQAA
jgi:hypothetical protein